MRSMVTAVVLSVLVLGIVGCGGSSSESSGDTTATVVDTSAGIETAGTESTSTDVTATDSNSTDTTATGTGGSGTTTSATGLSGECRKVVELSATFSQALGAAAADGKTDFEETAKAFDSFASQVPEEIRSAFRTLAVAFGTYADVLKGLDLSAGATPDPETLAKLADAAKRLDNEKLSKASAEIEAWAKTNCTP